MAGLPQDGRAGQERGAGQLGADPPGSDHFQLHAGLLARKALPGPVGRPYHLHRQRDGSWDFFHLRWEV